MNYEQDMLGKFANQGFSLKEDADHIIELWFKGQRIETFPQLGATKEVIQDACRRFISRLNGVVGVV